MNRCSEVALCMIGTAFLAGCDPLVTEIRMQAEIPRIDERVVSLELVTPLGTSSSRVVSYGVFTAALLEGTDDTVDDFLAGSAYPEDVRKGKLKLHIHEGGRFHGLWLPARDEFAWWQVKARVTIPSDLEDATVEWVE